MTIELTAKNDNALPSAPPLFSDWKANGFDDALRQESITHLAHQLPLDKAVLSNQYYRLCKIVERIKTALIHYPIALPEFQTLTDQFATTLANDSYDRLIEQMDWISTMAAIIEQPLLEPDLPCNRRAIAFKVIKSLPDIQAHLDDSWRDQDWDKAAFHLYYLMNSLAYSGLPRLKKVTFYLYHLLKLPVQSAYLQRTYDTLLTIIEDTIKTAVPVGFPKV